MQFGDSSQGGSGSSLGDLAPWIGFLVTELESRGWRGPWLRVQEEGSVRGPTLCDCPFSQGQELCVPCLLASAQPPNVCPGVPALQGISGGECAGKEQFKDAEKWG